MNGRVSHVTVNEIADTGLQEPECNSIISPTLVEVAV